MKNVTKISFIVLINLIIIMVLLEILLRLAAPVLPGAVGTSARLVTGGSQFEQDWSQAWQQNREHYWALRPNIDHALRHTATNS